MNQEVAKITQRQRDDQDYVKLWFNDEPCIKDKKGEIERYLFEEGDWESSADLMSSFKQWCIENNVKPVTPNQFSIALNRLGLKFERVGRNRTRGYEKVADGGRQRTASSQKSPISAQLETSESLPSVASVASAEKPHQNGHKPELLEELDLLLKGRWYITPNDGWFNITSLDETMPNEEEQNALTDFLADHKEEVTTLLNERNDL